MVHATSRSLSSLRVLEIGESVAASYAAKLLGDLGAHVIKAEAAGGDRCRRMGPFPVGHIGDPERSGLFLGLNTNKSSIELGEDPNQQLAALLEDCDIVVHALSPTRATALGLRPESLLTRHPGLVVCAVTAFGSVGPRANWTGEEINLVHGGGWGYLIPGDAPDLSTPPLTVFGHPASCQAGMAAGLAALGSFYKAAETGIGEYIDFSATAHVASMLESHFVAWSYLGALGDRAGQRLLNPWGIYECADGLVFIVTVEQDQWDRLVDMMGQPGWATQGLFDTVEKRSENADLLDIYLNEWTREHRVADLFAQGQSNRICFAPVFTMADLAEQDHLRARGFFARADHAVAGRLEYMAAPYRSAPELWRLDRTAPLLDADASTRFASLPSIEQSSTPAALSQRPLEGLRVIDFSWVWAGPFCTMHLAYLGADVIKIESSDRPGLGRRLPFHPPECEPSLNTGGYFNQWDQGKRSVELDLTDPASIETVLDLIAQADVVVDNYATGVMERLGLGDQVLQQANPDIVIASVTGYGHTGPLANYMGYGPTTAPLSGLSSMTGHAGDPPQEAGISFGDPAAGLTAAFAIMAALVERRAGGGGRRIDVSLWESTATNAIELWMGHALGVEAPERMGNRVPWAAPRGLFPCAGDDAWISIACMTDEQWVALAGLLGRDAHNDDFASLDGRKQHEDELEALVSEFTATRERWELTEALQAVGVAAYPSLGCDEIESDPQLVERNFWERFDHPEVGRRAHSGVPWITRNATNGVPRRAPLLGEHTAEVLAQTP